MGILPTFDDGSWVSKKTGGKLVVMREQCLNIDLVGTADEKIHFSSHCPINRKQTWYTCRGSPNYSGPKQQVHAEKLGNFSYTELNYTGYVDVILHNKLREYKK